jgi:endonuclease/exonuclease/phosphatase family metal-dependent hydrolase
VLKVVSWNIAHRPRAWTEVVAVDADIVLLQESNPNGAPSSDEVRIIAPPTANWKISRNNAYAASIVVLNPAIEYSVAPFDFESNWRRRIDASDPGQFSIVRINAGQLDVFLVSLYGVWGNGFADGSVHRAISDLTGLLESKYEVLVAGDLNTFRDHTLTGHRTALLRHQSVFSRLALFGLECVGPFGSEPLVACPCHDEVRCRHLRTYRHQGKTASKPLQLDFAFATKGLRSRVVRCEVLDEERYWAVSDHAPIVIELLL